MLEPAIVFEDEFLLVIDKPAGLVVNRAETTGRGETVQDWAETKLKFKNEDLKNIEEKEFYDRGGIVHRLDKDTSGLLVIAKTSQAFENLKNQFKDRLVKKKYWALVHGEVEPKEGTINAPIERSPFNRMHFGVFPGGREALTEYRTIKVFQSTSVPVYQFTLLELTPHTGRTHQIRVHLKYINHPIVSDPLYAGRKNLQADLKFCPRLFLHARFLEIRHPQSGELLKLESPLDPGLDEVLKLLSEVK